MYMTVLKRNQIVIFVLALMLVTAGYLSAAGGKFGDYTMVSSNSVRRACI